MKIERKKKEWRYWKHTQPQMKELINGTQEIKKKKKKKNSERNSRGKSQKKKNEIARLFYGHVPTLSPIVVEAERLNATTTNK